MCEKPCRLIRIKKAAPKTDELLFVLYPKIYIKTEHQNIMLRNFLLN